MSDDGNDFIAPESVPVNWYNGGAKQGTHAGTTESRIVVPTQQDVDGLDLQGRLCGTCRHFHHEEAISRINKENWVQTLTKDINWQVHHLGSPLNTLGLCGLHSGGGTKREGELLTGTLCKGCDQWQPASGRKR